MASIFTFDHEPPRVNSPWQSQSGQESGKRPQTERSVSTGEVLVSERSDAELDRLEAEPQEGPIEYKLHLLLRPRRAYKSMSTTTKVAGSQQTRLARDPKPPKAASQPLAVSNQTRQNRLRHLTTQLLWRLQQSSPYPATAKGDLVIPKLPEDNAELAILEEPRRLLPGLEESNGALYEIGVSDDGTFVGLTKDEMDESMLTLKIMAASLGCRVEVQRMKAVGTCEWADEEDAENDQVHHSDLWVAEALVMPILNSKSNMGSENIEDRDNSIRRGVSTAKQLRVSLTGPTTSGKTSLLGTLSNGALDNGRGSSRINLLKHQHEVASGRTSSVAQELIGYDGMKICNYTTDDINAWPDIHDRAENDRLVFFLDSAGHPRYQRTTLRALVGWAPHWTLLCIAANEGGPTFSGVHSLSGANGAIGEGIAYRDLAMAHLDLCLKLEMPLSIIITKYDLAQLGPFKGFMASILSRIKAAGRLPKLLVSNSGNGGSLTTIPDEDRSKIDDEVVSAMSASGNPLSVIPVILTSAVKGNGIGLTHALLRSLPMPPPPTSHDFVGQALNPEQPAALFHIDEVYDLPLSRAQPSEGDGLTESAPVVTGYLRFGNVSIGDKVVLGPFPADEDDSRNLFPRDHPSPGYGLSIPHPASAEYVRLGSRNPLSALAIEGEWRKATVVNMRNLRLPVRTIEAGQAASIQVTFEEPNEEVQSDAGTLFERPRWSRPRIRKGQVLAIPSQHMLDTGLTLQASTGLIASFKSAEIKSLAVGSMVNAYFGMVRAAARVLRVTRQKFHRGARQSQTEDIDDVFSMSDHGESTELRRTRSETDVDEYKSEYHVSLELLTNREWVELGSRVVLVEGSSKDRSGLEAHVGTVIEVTE
ncbi:hypothetical protein DL767_006403 [Monosporascus sp. MG133]|nr:hypothetical protein DL767_006403 [Monosporascus sp. MG133]